MHSPEHLRQKAAARAEAIDHLKSSVMHNRNGMQHEDHKNEEYGNLEKQLLGHKDNPGNPY